MENHCLRCNKYTEVNSFGYCKKCYNKVFKLSKHTTVEQNKIKNRIAKILLILFIVGCAVVVFIFRNEILDFSASIFGSHVNGDSFMDSTDSNSIISSYTPIESRVLDSDNYVRILDEYSAKEPDTDNYYYLFYSVYHYVTTEGTKYAQENPDDPNAAYQSIYGKTINQLISLGKYMMKENNISIEDVKNTISSLQNNS